MRRRARGESIVLVSILLGIAGLARGPGPDRPCRLIAGGDRGASLARQILRIDQEDHFDALWASLHRGSPPPRVDWGSRQVVALFAGEHPARHRLDIVSSRLCGDRVELELEEAIQEGGPKTVTSVPYLLLEAPADRTVEVRWRSTLVAEVPTRIE